VFARVTRFSGTPEQIDAGLRLYREQALPWLREASGFRGFVALVDPDQGRSVGITFWTTEQAAADAVGSGGALRDVVNRGVGTTMESLEVFEVDTIDGVRLDDLP
jgi:heme-degrading monooxygenase HmoA